MGAAQVQSQLRYLKTTTAAPRRRGRDRRRSDRGAGIAFAARTHGARPPACLLMCGCILPRCRRSLCSRHDARHDARIAVPTSRRSMPVAPRRTRQPRRSSLRFALCTATRAPPFRSARFAGPRMAVLFRSSPLPRVSVCAPWQAHPRAARALCGCALCRAATAELRNR